MNWTENDLDLWFSRLLAKWWWVPVLLFVAVLVVKKVRGKK